MSGCFAVAMVSGCLLAAQEAGWRSGGQAQTEFKERIAIFAARQDGVALGVLLEVLPDGLLRVLRIVVVDERPVDSIKQREVLLEADGLL